MCISQATNVEMENSVQAMCQIGMKVWMVLKPAHLVAINFTTLEALQCMKVSELENNEVVTMITTDNQATNTFVVVCKTGLLVYLL